MTDVQIVQVLAIGADTSAVQDRVRVLKQLVRESMYVIDERAVARAVLIRGTIRATLPDSSLRSGSRERPVRSFRRDRGARSFRLSGGAHLRAPQFSRR